MLGYESPYHENNISPDILFIIVHSSSKLMVQTQGEQDTDPPSRRANVGCKSVCDRHFA